MNFDAPFRYDSLYGIKPIRPLDAVRMDSGFSYSGIEVRESPYADLATKTVYKVVKTHPRARRKRYTVVKVKEPCILAFTDQLTGRKTLIVHPALMPGLKAACA